MLRGADFSWTQCTAHSNTVHQSVCHTLQYCVRTTEPIIKQSTLRDQFESAGLPRKYARTLTFDLDLQTRPSQGPKACEFGANPFSGSRDISDTNKKPQTYGAKNRTFRSSLRAVTSK